MIFITDHSRKKLYSILLFLLGCALIGVLFTINAIDHHLQQIHTQIQIFAQEQPKFYEAIEHFYGTLPKDVQNNYKDLMIAIKKLRTFDFKRILIKKQAHYFSKWYQQLYFNLKELSEDIVYAEETKESQSRRKEWITLQESINLNLIKLHALEMTVQEYNILVSEGITAWINYLFVDQKPLPSIKMPIDQLMDEISH